MKSITRMDSHIKIRVNMTKVELDREHSLLVRQNASFDRELYFTYFGFLIVISSIFVFFLLSGF